MRIALATLDLLASMSLSYAACDEACRTCVNVFSHVIHDPKCVAANVHLQGETAICRDGSHSMSELTFILYQAKPVLALAAA